MDRAGDDRADTVDRFDLLDRGGAKVGHLAEMDGEIARRLAAHVADAQPDQELSQRTLLARLDLGEEVVERLLADALEREQLLPAVREVVDVGHAGDEAQLRQAVGELFAEALDVHRPARGEVLDRAGDARRAAEVGAVVLGTAGVLHDGGAADRAAFGHREAAQLVLSTLAAGEDGAHHFGDDLAGALDDDVVADEQALGLDLVGVVEGRDAHARAADDHRLEDGKRGEHTGTSHRDLDVVEAGDRLLGGELVGGGPARLAADHAELALERERVDFHDHAVDRVRQLVAAAHPLLAELERLVDGLEAGGVRVDGEARVA